MQGEVAAAAQQVADREAEVGALRGELSQVAVRAFMGASTDGLGPMLADSSAFTDELQRDQLSRVALSAGDATTDELDQAVEDLQAQRAALEEAEDQAEAAADEVAATQEATEAQQAEYQQARTDAEGELGRLVQEEEERRARETYERMQREAEAAAAEAAEAQRAADASAQQQAQAAAPDDDDDDAAGRVEQQLRVAAAVATPAVAVEAGRWRHAVGGQRSLHPARVLTRGDGRERRPVPARRPVRRLREHPWRRLRLLGPDDVGVGPGRRLAARTSPGRSRAACPTCRSRPPSRAT